MGQESGPAILVGTVFTLFGAGLLVWTGARLRHGAPVADGVRPRAAVTVAILTGAGALMLGWWSFTRI